MRVLFALIKLFLFALLVILVIPTQSLVLLFTRGQSAYILPKLWHSAVRRVLNITIETVGTPHESSQVIFMSNHLSYLDIPVLGGLLKASFVAKEDVAHWPLFGFLATLQQTAFIQRKGSAARRVKNELFSMMNEGKNLIIFPEGTSTDGKDVRPFKSSLFMLAMEAQAPDLVVQPVTIEVLRTDGKALGTQDIRDLYAWHIDMDTDLGPHLWTFAKTQGSTLRITFHDPLRADNFDNRKLLSSATYDAVRSGLTQTQVA